MKKVLIIVGSILIIIFGLFFALQPSVDSPPLYLSPTEHIPNAPTLEHPGSIPSASSPSSNDRISNISPSCLNCISLSFDFGTEKKSFEISTDGQTSLFELIQNTNLEIATENFPPIGKMITSLNGFKNGTDGKYWQFWVNGQYSQIGASAYKPQPGDSIKWRFTHTPNEE